MQKNQNVMNKIFAAVNLPRKHYTQLLVVVVVLSVEEEDLALDDVARVVVVALDVVELTRTLLELEALVDVEADALRLLEADTLDETEVVELTEPAVDDPGEFPEPGVAVCQ
jgi:hypothetical protein